MTLVIRGAALSLSHLAPIERRILVPLRGGKTKKILVEFYFSNHCYSRLPEEGEEIPPGLRIPDGSKQMPRDRIFDQRRYDLSLQVMGCIDDLISADGDVHKSRHNNYFRVDTLEETMNGVVTSVAYYIFMSARKVTEAEKEKRVRVHVESAYPEKPTVPSPAVERVLPFAEVLGMIWDLRIT